MDAHEEARRQVRDAAEAVTAALVAAWLAIQVDLARLRSRWVVEPYAVRYRRLQTFQAAVLASMRTAAEGLRSTVPVAVHEVFTAGAAAVAPDAGVAAAGAGDAEVLAELAQATYDDLLAATQYVSETTKALVRDLARAARNLQVEDGASEVEAARYLEQALAERGVAAVVYRDGSRHGLDDYSRMLTRTRLAEVRQVAGFRVMDRAGVTFVELTDGPGCGLTTHSDPLKANGLVLPIEQAMTVPIAHPNCVRAAWPRPDIRDVGDAGAASPQRPVPASGGESSPFESVAARSSSGLLDLMVNVAPSPAAARHASLAARRAALASGQPGSGVSVTARVRTVRTPRGGPGAG